MGDTNNKARCPVKDKYIDRGECLRIRKAAKYMVCVSCPENIGAGTKLPDTAKPRKECGKCGKDRVICARGMCSNCYRKERVAERILPESGAAEKTGSERVVLDFKNETDLFRCLRDLSTKERRTLSQQILYMLEKMVLHDNILYVEVRDADES